MRYLCLLIVCVMLTACQHQSLTFTDAEPPQLQPLQPLHNAPDLAPFAPLALASPQTIALGDHHFIHILPTTDNATAYIKVVGYKRNGAWKNADILMNAFREIKPDLATSAQQTAQTNVNTTPTVHQFWTGSISGERSTLASTSFVDSFDQDLVFLLSLWSQNPFTAIPMTRLKRQMKLNAREQQFFGSDYFRWWNQIALGSAHPYLRLLSHSQIVDSLDQQHLNAIWEDIRQADEWHIFLAGNIQESAISSALRAQILALPLANTASIAPPTLPAATPFIIHLLDAPGDAQTSVVMGYANADTAPSNSLACAFIAQWLGGSFSGRLFADLRERRGLAYNIGGGCEQKPLALMLRFNGATRLENTGAFVAGIRDHLKLAQQEPISDTELALVKQQLLSRWRIALDTPENQLDIYAHLRHMGRQWDTLQLLEQRLAELSAADIQRFSAELLAQEPVLVLRTDVSKVLADIKAKFPDARLIIEKSVPETMP